jgi:hypothetical protein
MSKDVCPNGKDSMKDFNSPNISVESTTIMNAAIVRSSTPVTYLLITERRCSLDLISLILKIKVNKQKLIM